MNRPEPSVTDQLSDSGATEIQCDHCGLPVPAGLIEAAAEKQFCCGGCRFAFQLIHEHQLDAYYRMVDREPGADVARPGSDQEQQFSEYDQPAFLKRYGQQLDNGLAQVTLMLDGIHCAACIWLIEKLPRICPGVTEAQVNWTRRTVRVRWNPTQIALSQVAGNLARLGYRPYPIRANQKEDRRRQENHRHLIRIGMAAAAAGNNMLIAAALYLGMFSTMHSGLVTLFRVASCLIGLFALLGPGRIFLQGAWAAVRTRTPHMDLPIALGLLVGTIAGLVNTVRGTGEIYFDSLSVLIFLLLVGRWIQFRQQNRAVDAIEMLGRLTPRTARKMVDDRVVETFVDMIEIGDRLEVRAGDVFPVDGKIDSGSTAVDESMLSGESRLVKKFVGDSVLAGTQNQAATVQMLAETTEQQTRVSQIVSMVEQASIEKPEIVQWANRIGGYFVAVVLAAAVLTFLVWVGTDTWTAVDRTVALLIVACPCALALATPLAISVALGRAARNKIMIKGGDVLQRLTRPGTIWLDKTGTLTRGKLEVVDYLGDKKWLSWITAVEAHSDHPVARAIVVYSNSNIAGAVDGTIESVEHSLQGGLRAETSAGTFLIGTRKLLLTEHVDIPIDWDRHADQILQRNLSPCWIAVDGQVQGLLAIGDQLRKDSQECVSQLQDAGWRVGILSGDHESIVRQVGQRLGLRAEDCIGGVVPEDKLRQVRRSLKNDETVLMVGDGVNDSAALAAASVGIAVHGGAEASLSAAPVYLAEDGLMPILRLLKISRSNRRTMLINLSISLTYNLIFATLAFLGYINPLVAAILMPISSLTVVAMSMTSGASVNQDPSAVAIQSEQESR